MKRLLTALALLLIVPAGADAKGLVSMSVCGTNGCHTTRDRQELADATDSAPQSDPGTRGPYFTVRQVIGEPGFPAPVARQLSHWYPSTGVVQSSDEPLRMWTLPTPATTRVLHRLSTGLHPFGAAQTGSAGSFPWTWALLALPAAGLAAWLALRRRRRPALA